VHAFIELLHEFLSAKEKLCADHKVRHAAYICELLSSGLFIVNIHLLIAFTHYFKKRRLGGAPYGVTNSQPKPHVVHSCRLLHLLLAQRCELLRCVKLEV